MSKTVLAEVDGFTPVIDNVVEEVGAIAALVFGKIWRYCQLSDGVCRASLDKIGQGVGLNKATIMRNAKKLVECGYLEDTTPKLRNKPHVYKDTGKASMSISVTVAQSNTGVAQSNVTVAESKLKIDSKTLKDIGVSKEKKPRPRNPIHDSLVEVTKYPAGSFNGLVTKKLREANPDKSQEWIAGEIISRFGVGSHWYNQDFRGKQGQPPTPMQVVQEWNRVLGPVVVEEKFRERYV